VESLGSRVVGGVFVEEALHLAQGIFVGGAEGYWRSAFNLGDNNWRWNRLVWMRARTETECDGRSLELGGVRRFEAEGVVGATAMEDC